MKAKQREQLSQILTDDQLDIVETAIEQFIDEPKNNAVNMLYAFCTRNSYYYDNLRQLGLEKVPEEALPIIFRAMRYDWENTPVTYDDISEEEIEESENYEKESLLEEVNENVKGVFPHLFSSAQSVCSKYTEWDMDYYVMACMVVRKCKFVYERAQKSNFKKYTNDLDFIVSAFNPKANCSDSKKKIAICKLGLGYEVGSVGYLLPLGDSIFEILSRMKEKEDSPIEKSIEDIENEKNNAKITINISPEILDCLKNILSSLKMSGVDVSKLVNI